MEQQLPLGASPASETAEQGSSSILSNVLSLLIVAILIVSALLMAKCDRLSRENAALKQYAAVTSHEMEVTERLLKDLNSHYMGALQAIVDNYNDDRSLLQGVQIKFDTSLYEEDIHRVNTSAPYTNSLSYWRQCKIVGFVETPNGTTFDPTVVE